MVTWTDHAKIATTSHKIYSCMPSEILIRKELWLNELLRLGREAPELNGGSVRELPLCPYLVCMKFKQNLLKCWP